MQSEFASVQLAVFVDKPQIPSGIAHVMNAGGSSLVRLTNTAEAKPEHNEEVLDERHCTQEIAAGGPARSLALPAALGRLDITDAPRRPTRLPRHL
jgi:hypothetical protein